MPWGKKTALVLMASLVVAALAASPAQATTLQVIEPVSFVMGNPCSGELIAVDGVFHSVFFFRDGNLESHAVSVRNTQQFKGVGVTSGDLYRIAVAEHASVYYRFEPAPTRVDVEMSNVTVTQTLRVVSARSGDNFSLVLTQHFTFTPVGEVTAEVSEVRTTCQG